MGLKLILFFILILSLGFHVPSDAYAADGDVTSTVEINDYTANGPELSDDDYFGSSIANIGDLNGDGVEDIAVGATGDDDGGKNRGAIHIMFMNTDGSVDSTVEINDSTPNGPELSIKDNLGFSIANIGDLDGDGINDIAVGAHQDDMDETGDDEGGLKRGAVHIMFLVGTPVPLTAIKSSGSTVDLSWDTARGSPTYTIYSSSDNITFTSLGTTASSAYQHEDASLSYPIYYKITFTNVYGESIESSIAIITSSSSPSKKYAPHIHDEVTVSINSNEEFTLNLKDEEIAKITSNVGDTVDITFGVSDDEESFLSKIKLMTNFAQTRSQASGINPYFANNFNDFGKVGFSVYEWYQYKDDIKYDYGGAISWNEPRTMSHEIQTNREDTECALHSEEELIIVFSLNMNNVMDETQIVTEIMDSTYQIKRSVLPFTLETLSKTGEKPFDIPENPIILEENESEFSIKLNKPMYEHGNKVVISGQIPSDSFDPKNGETVEFSITSPENEIILTGEFAPLLDGSFIFETYAMDSTWKTDGNYTFNLNFGLIDSNLIIPYDNSQFENVELQPIIETIVFEENIPEIKTENIVFEEKLPQLTIAAFVDQSKDPQHYIDRYFNESKYKQWFDKNYPQYLSIHQAVGLEESVKENSLSEDF